MLALLGTFGLGVGFSAALGSIVLWARAATGGDTTRPARWGTWLMTAGAVGAVVVLEWALLSHDFSVRFVAENGSLATPTYYTITSMWAAHDGSLMLWLLVLTIFITIAALLRPRGAERLHPWAMTVLSAVAAFFFGLTLFTSHAFETVFPVPDNGPGPNPLLQDHPAMGIHPPLLYIGYVGLSVPFAYAVAGLITGDVGTRWLRVVRSYTLVAWTALTAGIVLGAWWSYAVLGWGGYWAWDPVENASLMPWLVATALLHSGMVQRQRGALPAWNVALGITAFLLACLGTFLTRSGVVISVHAFASSPVGPVLLGFLVALAVGVTAIVMLRADRLRPARGTGPLLSRGSALLLNNLLLTALTATVLLGTLFPLFAETVADRRLSVGPPYYNRMAVPIALVLILLMAAGPLLRWRGDEPARLLRAMAAPVAIGAVTVVALALAGVHQAAPLLAFGLAAMVAATVVLEWLTGIRETRAALGGGWAGAVARWSVRRRRRICGMLVHLGVAVVVVGVAASSAYTSVSEQRVRVGEAVTTAGVSAELVGVDRARSDRAMRTAAHLRLSGEGRDGDTVDPALRFFPAHQMTVASPAIRSSVFGDVYLTLLAVNQKGTAATVRLAVNPMVGWIWAGGAVMALGGVLTLWPRRRGARPTTATEQVPEAELEVAAR